MKINNFFKLIIAIGFSELVGVIGSVFTVSAIPSWYSALQKPALTPPSWVFGPVWISLYALMGVAAFLVWSSCARASADKKKGVKVALILFGGQLVLNMFWSIVFFGLKNPFWAFINIITLWLAIIWTITVFYRISKPALIFECSMDIPAMTRGPSTDPRPASSTPQTIILCFATLGVLNRFRPY
jgi:tryptophan-rich sensory protein